MSMAWCDVAFSMGRGGGGSSFIVVRLFIYILLGARVVFWWGRDTHIFI